jgi:hypothetical protein
MSKGFVYIENQHFNNKMAPHLIGEASRFKKLIAWHKQSCEVP